MHIGNNELFIREIVFSLFLFIFSWQDIRRNQIRVSWLWGFGTVGIGLNLICFAHLVLVSGWNWKQGTGVAMWLLGMLPGLLLLWIERLTQGKVGLGDGWFFLIAGLYLGGWRTLELLMGAVFVSSLVGGIWILAALPGRKEKGLWEQMRKKRIPFLPCVIPAWGLILASAMG